VQMPDRRARQVSQVVVGRAGRIGRQNVREQLRPSWPQRRCGPGLASYYTERGE
jgi:hypothetical protein